MNSFLRAALLSAMVIPSVVTAQTENVGPLILRLSSSARALAMGNVAVTGRDDDVLFYNPAQLVAARGMSLSAEQYSSTARTGALSSVVRFNTGGIAVGATIAEFDTPLASGPPARDVLVSGGSVHASTASLVVGVGQVFKSTRFGVAAKLVEDRIGPARSTLGVFDAGLGRDFFGYSFGLAVQNIGQTFEPSVPSGSGFAAFKTKAPLRATFGASRGWFFNSFDLAATAAVSTLRDGFVVPAGGVEVGWGWLDGYNVLLRAGARRPEPGEGAMTAGAGFTMDRLSVDYALETLAGSRVAHRIGLRIR